MAAVSHGADPLCLVLETSNPGINAEVGVGRLQTDGKPPEILAIEPVKAVGRNEDDVLPAIDRACRAAGVTPSAFRLVGVSTGPGGYTSLRVACAAGKMIAEACGARCVSIPTALVAALATPGRSGRVGVLLAGKDDSAFLTVFPGGRQLQGAPLPEGTLVTASSFPLDRVDAVIGDKHVPRPIQELVRAHGLPLIEPRLGAAACLELAAVLPAIDPVELVPVYPREPDAVTLWRARSRA